MLEVTFDIDLEDVIDGFDDMKREARDLTSAWREASPDLQKDIREHGRRKEGPDDKWPKLAKSTLKNRKAKRKRGKKPAVAILGKLRRNFTIEWGPKFLRARSRVLWSGVHQEGGVVGHGAVIPARPHIYAGKEFFKKLIDIIINRITVVF
jgi:phage gpG-like protein